MRYSKADKEKAVKALNFLKKGDTVYTVLNSCSRSGMTRHIKPVVIVDGQPQWIGYHVAALLDEPLDRNGGVKQTGCGMDMGFNLVYNLSYILFKDKETVGDAGYCLKQSWM